MTRGVANARKNFFLWGAWGDHHLTEPLLTQKIDAKIRNTVIGHGFIVALLEDGSLLSWGEDKNGCLGLGSERLQCAEPARIKIPEASGRVADIQFGDKHILALTEKGQVYSWGDNKEGQLGAGDTARRMEPHLVEGIGDAAVQVVCYKDSSFMLTAKGVIFAWGCNKNSELAVGHDEKKVLKPEPILALQQQEIKRIDVKGNTIVAYVNYTSTAQHSVGWLDTALGDQGSYEALDEALCDEVFEGLSMLRHVTDNCKQWYAALRKLKHGEPYEDINSDDPINGLEMDSNIAVEVLQSCAFDIEQLIRTSQAQLQEVSRMKGTKSAKFTLILFGENCRLRKEKVLRAVAARSLLEKKKGIPRSEELPSIKDMQSKTEIQKLKLLEEQLQHNLEAVRRINCSEVLVRELQASFIQCMEQRIQNYQLQIELLKKKGSGDPVAPALRAVKDRWKALQQFSVSKLYQECDGQQFDFGDDVQLLAFLVQASDAKINNFIQVDKDELFSRDHLIPHLCYDLLLENAELRKMCNQYQLRVMLLHKGNHCCATLKEIMNKTNLQPPNQMVQSP
eukprot:GEMP01033403.1.p1 GENE.GEMP01033403.1~~GEMP01033403.1.p1  ORF type:complete len:565 (+),score=117.86 GEMP01033403.1:48-1742(+)